MVGPSSSVNMERLKDRNVELCRLFAVLFVSFNQLKKIKG